MSSRTQVSVAVIQARSRRGACRTAPAVRMVRSTMESDATASRPGPGAGDGVDGPGELSVIGNALAGGRCDWHLGADVIDSGWCGVYASVTRLRVFVRGVAGSAI
ncbi:hypothetical protein GCM10009630_61150 [Kribbella jejuensis]